MKKIHAKKLALSTQSIRPLATSDLERVIGGNVVRTRNTCESMHCLTATCEIKA